MPAQTQYVVPVFNENERTWSKIHMLAQRVNCLFDEYGNLQGCRFAKVNNPWLGEFYVFQALDKTVAETLREALVENTDLRVFPVREVQYQDGVAPGL